MILRPATAADAPALAAIYAHHVTHGLGTFEEAPPDAAEMARRLAAIQAQDLPWLVAADAAGAILGYAYAGPFRTRAAYRFTLEDYDYDPGADRIGLQAAEAIGADPATVLKTLMTEVDGKPVCVVVPSDREVSMKALARAAGGKTATMMRPADAERATGFVVGGISPFGQKRRAPTIVEEAALAHALVYVNAGQRGLQARLAPADLVAALAAKTAAIVA